MDDEVISRYITGNSSESESELVRRWIDENIENQEYIEEFKKIWDHSGSVSLFNSIDIEEGWENVKSRIGENEDHEVRLQPEKAKSWLFQFSKIAAVFLLIIAAAFLLNQFYNKNSTANYLSFSSNEHQENLVLPDGSTVYLNSGTTIRYPEKFRRKKREVELIGEAFFEVTPDTQKPFRISIGDDAIIEVLGTSFNVLSEDVNNQVVVHVVSGQVSLYDPGKEESGLILSANEKGVLSGGEAKKTGITDPNFMSWKSGVLTFENTPLTKVIRKIKRQYNKEIALELNDPDSILFTSTFKDQPVEEVIEEIVLVLGVQYRYQNDTIVIFK